MARKNVFGFAALWLAMFAYSIISFLTTAKTGDGFTRGMDQLVALIGWQSTAFLVAVIVAVALKRLGQPRGRLLSFVGFGPVIISGLVMLTTIIVIFWAGFSNTSVPVNVEPTRPTTKIPKNAPERGG